MTYMIQKVKSVIVKSYIEKKLGAICPSCYTYGTIKEKESYMSKTQRKTNIYDVLRFSVVVNHDDHYVQLCEAYKKQFDDKRIITKNYWLECYPYKGFHIQVLDVFQPFEIQIHTTQSHRLRENKWHHVLYKKSVEVDNTRATYKLLYFFRFCMSILLQVHAYKIRRLFEQAHQQ